MKKMLILFPIFLLALSINTTVAGYDLTHNCNFENCCSVKSKLKKNICERDLFFYSVMFNQGEVVSYNGEEYKTLTVETKGNYYSYCKLTKDMLHQNNPLFIFAVAKGTNDVAMEYIKKIWNNYQCFSSYPARQNNISQQLLDDFLENAFSPNANIPIMALLILTKKDFYTPASRFFTKLTTVYCPDTPVYHH